MLPLDEARTSSGNPPFGGAEFESLEQRAQVHRVAGRSATRRRGRRRRRAQGDPEARKRGERKPTRVRRRRSRPRHRASARRRHEADPRRRVAVRLGLAEAPARMNHAVTQSSVPPLPRIAGGTSERTAPVQATARMASPASAHVTVDDDSARTGTDPVVAGRQALARLRESLEPADFPVRDRWTGGQRPPRAPPVRTTETSVGNGIGGCRSLPARSTRAAIPGVGSPRESSSRSGRGLECHLHRGTGKNTCSRGRGAPGPLPRGVRDPPE